MDCVSSNLRDRNLVILGIDLRTCTAVFYCYYLVQNDRNAPKHFLSLSQTSF